MSSAITVLDGFRWCLIHRRVNGLTDDMWVPMFCVDRWVVDTLLTELRRAGVPAQCTRLGAAWHLGAHSGRWCLWVGYDSYGQAQERLVEVMPLLVRSLRHGTETA